MPHERMQHEDGLACHASWRQSRALSHSQRLRTEPAQMSQALLLIDLQNDYFPGGDYTLAGIEAASERAAELLARFRDAGRPLIHVRHEFASAEAPFFRPGTLGAEIHPSVAPAAGETVVTKGAVNAFQGTDLKQRLDALGVGELVIAGAMSHMCIEGATRAAADLGYKCQVIHDACATREQTWGGRVVSAADVHAASMSALGFAYAEVLGLSEWRG
jgi:nicotinamidase-related amidase